MAHYDNLPVYKACYDLLQRMFRLSGNMQRDYRFSVGESMKKELIELIINIYRANCRYQKATLIETARENIEVIRLLLRLTNDMKQISLKEFISANESVESISKQLAAWHKSCKQ